MLIHKQSTVARQTTASKVQELWKWFFVVVGFSNRSEKCSSKSFYRIPEVVSHHDKETQEIPSKRRSAGTAASKEQILTQHLFTEFVQIIL